MILTKIFFTVSTQSDLGRIIEPESLKVEDYLNRTVLKLAQAVDGEKSSPAGKFAMVLITVKYVITLCGKCGT